MLKIATAEAGGAGLVGGADDEDAGTVRRRVPFQVAGPGPALFEKFDSRTTWLSFTDARNGCGAADVMCEGFAE